MSNVSNQSVLVDAVVEEKPASIQPAAVLRQMSWALSYPSAGVEDFVRSVLAQSGTDGCKKCA